MIIGNSMLMKTVQHTSFFGSKTVLLMAAPWISPSWVFYSSGIFLAKTMHMKNGEETTEEPL